MESLKIDTAGYVVRERYLSALEAFIDQPVVKVLTGMRRVGKSVIMRLLIENVINRDDKQGQRPINLSPR